jgi:hypothetical protein
VLGWCWAGVGLVLGKCWASFGAVLGRCWGGWKTWGLKALLCVQTAAALVTLREGKSRAQTDLLNRAVDGA